MTFVYTNPEASAPSFKGFLSRYRFVIVAILFLSICFRLFLVIRYPLIAGDENRYTTPAINLLSGRGFTSDLQPPYGPTEHVVPLYPIFIAAVYRLFGEHNVAVRIAQGLVDLITCVLVGFVAFNLASPRLSASASIVAMAIYGFLSWFTVHWNRYILTEILALFFTVLAIAATIAALQRSHWRWLAVGAVCGLGLLTRADSVLLAGAFIIFLTTRVVLRKHQAFSSLILFCFALAIVLSPWIIRNYKAFGRFQPLASEYGFARGGFMPTGYLWWIRTWMSDETYVIAFRPAFAPDDASFEPRMLPDSAFDSPEERQQVFEMLDGAKKLGRFTQATSDGFLAIAKQRIRRDPFRFFIALPAKRIVSIWLTGFATGRRPYLLLRILLVLPILVGGLFGFAFCVRSGPLAQLLILVILARTIFFAYHYSPEARYIVEAYPVMIAACGVSGAVLCNYLARRFGSRRNSAGIEKQFGV